MQPVMKYFLHNNYLCHVFVYIYTDPKNVVSPSSSIYPEHTSDFAQTNSI